MTATFYVGDAIEVMGKLPEKSVDLILTSPPFLALRSYLPADHPDKALEGGSQATPGAFIDWLVDVVEACARVLAPHGSMCIELGDTYAGSGEGGGDLAGSEKYAAGQRTSNGTAWRSKKQGGWPLAKSLSLIPELFRLTLVYGTNPLTGRQTERWRLRNVVRWVRPNPPVGALGDKFRPATSELMVFCKSAKRYFDLDAVREPLSDSPGNRYQRVAGNYERAVGQEGRGDKPVLTVNYSAGAPPLDWWNIPLLEGEEETRYGPTNHNLKDRETNGPKSAVKKEASGARTEWGQFTRRINSNPAGSPPLDWWNIPPGGYEGAHYAVFPPELCVKPIKAMSPERVCRQCGEPSRRIVTTQPELSGQKSLADEIASRRNQAGVSRADMVAWFPHYKNGESVMAQVSNWELAKNVPSPGDWEILKKRLGVSDTFDELVNSDRRWIEPSVTDEYRENLRHGEGSMYSAKTVEPKARHGARPMTTKTAEFVTLGFSDCGHDDWRPGLVLDPFGGSGTTALVATGHGRDAILIDLDERNYDLALQRVGPFILQRGAL